MSKIVAYKIDGEIENFEKLYKIRLNNEDI